MNETISAQYLSLAHLLYGAISHYIGQKDGQALNLNPKEC